MFIILITAGCPSYGQLTAYVGIAGSGSGMGTMGHGFLVIAKNPGEFLDADAYRYEMVVPPNFKLSINNIKELSHLRFIVGRSPAWTYLQQYSKQQRYVHLFELTLDEKQVRQLVRNVEIDRVDRLQHVRTDYRVESSNCLTKIYDQINSVVEPNQAIHYHSLKYAPYNFSYVHPSELGMVVPLSAAMFIKKSKVVRRVVKFQPALSDQLRAAVALRKSLRHLLLQCGTSDAERETLIRLATNPRTLKTKSFIDFLSTKTNECTAKSTELKDEWNSVLDLISFSADDSTFAEFLEKKRR